MYNVVCLCRLLEIISNKIFAVQKDDAMLECLNSTGTKTYRVEEIPAEEATVTKDELLVPVAHFQKVSLLTPYKRVSHRKYNYNSVYWCIIGVHV